MGKVARRVLGIAPEETSFARRGFRCDSDAVRERLEEVGRCFVHGYLRALETGGTDGVTALGVRLEAEVARENRGFAYEGAGMALALLDCLVPWGRRRGRLQRFLAGPGRSHVYIVHVGAGWALARLPIPVDRLLSGLHPMFRWLALDGYGFHQGFFHWPQAVARQQLPRRLAGYARRAFDQGVGRSLWFVEGADPGRIAADVHAFPAARRPHLWSGVGLACGYAGGVDRDTLAALCLAAGPARPALAQGVAFAAKARLLAGNPTAGTALACAAVCGMTVEEVAAVTDRALPDGIPPDGTLIDRALPDGTLPDGALPDRPLPAGTDDADGVPSFELWRQRIQQQFASLGATS